MVHVLVDHDLGHVRYCPGCDDWWPVDDEFWFAPDDTLCRACVIERDPRVRGRERQRRYRERRRATA